jgi:hypothetical protein
MGHNEPSLFVPNVAELNVALREPVSPSFIEI